MDPTTQHVVEQTLLNAAKIIEDQLDAELQKMDNLKEDDLEKLRERRLQQMKLQAKQQQELRAKGHGEYTELGDQKDFFEIPKHSRLVVRYFFCFFFCFCVFPRCLGEQLNPLI
jgi:hypothetical protein